MKKCVKLTSSDVVSSYLLRQIWQIEDLKVDDKLSYYTVETLI